MSATAPPSPIPLSSKHRIEALSDGVFAVVMTLLVLEIKPELGPNSDDEAVRHLLRNLAIPVLTFAIAFLISCIFWNLHHRKFSLLRSTNPVHTGLTLVFLFTVTLLPVSVSIYLHAKSSNLARAVYFGNFTLIALPLLLSWLYALRSGLVDPTQPDPARLSPTPAYRSRHFPDRTRGYCHGQFLHRTAGSLDHRRAGHRSDQ